jgi:hypothetical protein
MKDKIYQHIFDKNGYRCEEVKPKEEIKKAKAIILKSSIIKVENCPSCKLKHDVPHCCQITEMLTGNDINKDCPLLDYDVASELFDYFYGGYSNHA